jgi:hypothetical protein
MSGRRCIVCGRPCRISHHLTGGALDDDLVADVCSAHHRLVHLDWYTLEVGAKQSPRNYFDRLYLRLVRLAAFFGRLVAAGMGAGLLELPATAIARWAEGLQTRVGLLDKHCPGWRQIVGMDE